MEEERLLVRTLALLGLIDDAVNNNMVGNVEMFMFTTDSLYLTECGACADGIKLDDEMNILIHFSKYESRNTDIWLNIYEYFTTTEAEGILDYIEDVITSIKEIHIMELTHFETLPSGSKITLFDTTAFTSRTEGYRYVIRFKKENPECSFAHYVISMNGGSTPMKSSARPTELEMAEMAVEEVMGS